MNIKTFCTAGLLLFVAASIAVPILRGMTRAKDLGAGIPAPARPDAIVVCYFRANIRCAACRTLEACSREVVEKRLATQAVAGGIEWQAIDYQAPGNEQLLAEYQLITGGIVLVEFREGQPRRWQALTEIWNMTGDRTALMDYLADAIGRFGKEGQ
jgi:hypothetical protein